MIEVPLEISRLSNREADRMLEHAEQARLAEIDRYWALCHADPDGAARAADGMAPIVGDIFHLACDALAVPEPSAVAGLSTATARLLDVPAVRESLVDETRVPMPADPADWFWEGGRIVALKMMGEEPIVVVRYDGPLFNPDTVPEHAVTAGEDWYLVCQRASDGDRDDYEFLTAYVIGGIAGDGRWKPIPLDLQTRNEVMRNLEAMETLVEFGRLSSQFFDVKPLVDFPTGRDVLIAQLQAHKAALRTRAAISPTQQAIVESRTTPLYERAKEIRRKMKRMEDALYRIRGRIAEVEARALEQETGFARGDTVRHRSTGEDGTLEITRVGSTTQFRLRGSRTDLTGDIRRGEWIKLASSSSAIRIATLPLTGKPSCTSLS